MIDPFAQVSGRLARGDALRELERVAKTQQAVKAGRLIQLVNDAREALRQDAVFLRRVREQGL